MWTLPLQERKKVQTGRQNTDTETRIQATSTSAEHCGLARTGSITRQYPDISDPTRGCCETMARPVPSDESSVIFKRYTSLLGHNITFDYALVWILEIPNTNDNSNCCLCL